MHLFPPWPPRACRVLAERVHRLRDSWRLVAERLRHTVARTMDRSAAAAVHEAVQVLIARCGLQPRPPARAAAGWPGGRGSCLVGLVALVVRLLTGAVPSL
jgi:hypothetical protein